MLLVHRMVDGNKMLVLHILNSNAVVIIGRFCFQRRQGNAAAADQGITGGVEKIAAKGTDIESTPQHIGGDVSVGNMFAIHQFNDRNPQSLG